MYESRRKRGVSGRNAPRIRRPGSTAGLSGSSGNLERPRRPSDSAPGRILGARARLRGGVSETYEIQRKSGPGGAKGTRIRRPGLTVGWSGSSRNLDDPARSSGSETGRILGARAILRGGASEMYESRRKRGAGGAKGHQNQAVRNDGRSVRIFAKSRGIPPTVGFGRMACLGSAPRVP